ncbi:hypothetical protein [Streptosporangium longisporum]|uniref:Uncharacterized protein n=1 Tax=Streptosporangium longisporum TaxID=46187 RepID=A0ABP6LCU6_9ACTN
MRYVVVALLSIGAMLVSVPAHAAPARTSAQEAVVGSPEGPHCPDQAPEGAEFVEHVRTRGIPYDLYVVTEADGSKRHIQVFCWA